MNRGTARSSNPQPVELEVTGLSHDGRGVATCEGKKVFVRGGLPGERVAARWLRSRRRSAEAEVVAVLAPSPDRVEPRCPHFGYCGGCALQHCNSRAQLLAKQETLIQNLQRIGGVQPAALLDPLSGPEWNYRRKARLSARYVAAKGRLLLGFRERQGHYVADIRECHVLDRRIADQLPELTRLLGSLSNREHLPQVEVSCGDRACALVLRHLEPFQPADLDALRNHALRHDTAVLLQPGGTDTIHAFEPAEVRLDYDLPEFGLTLEFGPADFIQVNGELNRLMVERAVGLLEIQPRHRVLDLYCGMGNFTLPIARTAGEVVGVEGDPVLVEKARANAERNGIGNAQFWRHDLAADVKGAGWMTRPFDRVLLDPPRTGAAAMLQAIAATGARRLVYVSCHPGSLARDAGPLVKRFGYRLEAAGVMDMFPHTSHVESIAVFARRP